MSKYIIITIIFAIGLWMLHVTPEIVQESKPDYTHIKAEVTDHDNNICTLTFDSESVYKIDVRYFEEDETLAGEWDAEFQRIRLSEKSGLDIDTVAHEVSHAIDYIMIEYQIEDHHYEAYMQGQLTLCIWQIVQEDVNPKEPEDKFRFAN